MGYQAWVAIPEFVANTPDPLTFDSQVNSALS
jgi:hypothetical protein